jgi:hypothetical protein
MANFNLITEITSQPLGFQAFVDEQMKKNTFIPEWKGENVEIQYSASKSYREIISEYAAAAVGSIVSANAAKPTHELPTAGEITGAISRMADEWQLDNAKLDEFYFLQARYNDRFATYSDTLKAAEASKLADALFNNFDKAVIAPHKRIDLLYFEGLFNGTQTVSTANNAKSSVSYSYPTGAHKEGVAVLWSDKDNADALADIEAETNRLASIGKTVIKVRMSKRTFRAMCATKKLKEGITQVGTKGRVTGTGILGIDVVNEYFESAQLPTIQIEKDRFVTLPDGSTTNLVPDNRVVFQCADTVAVIKAADPLEIADPLPNKQYAQYEGNLVGLWRSERGRFVDYDMYAVPVFVGRNNYSILAVDEVKK